MIALWIQESNIFFIKPLNSLIHHALPYSSLPLLPSSADKQDLELQNTSLNLNVHSSTFGFCKKIFSVIHYSM